MAEGTVTLAVVSQSRAPVGQVEVPAAVVAGPVREHLLQAAVHSQLAARRAGTAATKTKGFVSGGGKKPWRQKGTGRARAGSIRSPLWAGGATIFGPQPRDYTYRMPKSARQAALRAALPEADSAIERAARNLPGVKVLRVAGLNVHDVLGHAEIVFTRAALEQI